MPTIARFYFVRLNARQVEQLISQVADEYGLQLSEKMGPAPAAKVQQKEEQDELTQRLNNLKAI